MGKMIIKFHSISLQLLFFLAISLLLPLSVGMLLSLQAERSRLEDELLFFQKQSLEDLVRSAADDLATFSPGGAQSSANVLIKDSRIVRIEIYSDIYGMFLVDFSKETSGSDFDVFSLRQNIVENKEVLGYIAIAVDRNWVIPQVKALEIRTVRLFVIMFAGGFFLIVPLMYFRLLKPLNRLAEQAEILSSGNLDIELDWQGKDELSLLGRTLEKMRCKLNADFNRILVMAVTDELTRLPNRRAFMQEGPMLLELSRRYKWPLTLALLDIDWFKQINDTFGHATGDEVLKELGHVLSHRVRKSDLFARYGGEEFALCMPETSLEDAARFLEKLRQYLAERPFPHGRPVTVSIGLAQFTGGQSLEELVNNADTALYKAKEKGRNRVEIFPEPTAG